jgi:hypothetical protein
MTRGKSACTGEVGRYRAILCISESRKGVRSANLATTSLLDDNWCINWRWHDFLFGLPILSVGAIMLFYGAIRLGSQGVWAAMISLGVVPAAIILYGYFSTDHCAAGIGYILPANGPRSMDSGCGTFSDNYLESVWVFGAVAFGGMVWGLISVYRARTSGDRTAV